VICPACRTENDGAVDVCFNCGKALSALTRGSVLGGRYEIVDVLGRGGMGIVYKAYDRMLEESIAIKVLRRDLTAAPELARRFRSEIKLARRVSHPNVCRIHEYGQEGDLNYISMAFVEGHDLRHMLAQNPDGLPSADAYAISIQTARGLHAIHEVGILHRDLKTPNIMRDPHGVVRLMDFGIAKEFGEAGAHSVTATGAVMGTPEYMSPEQCRGENLDARSDIYSLGVVVFEIFTGQVPFRGDSLMATLFKHIQEPPPFAGPLGARLPDAVVPVLAKALAKARDQRYATAAEMATALEQARAKRVVPIEPTAPVVPAHDRRAHTRLGTPVNVRLRRLDAHGRTLHEERTIADNIGRGGARVMTAMSGLALGETIELEEVGGDFHTRTKVRHTTFGADHIQRLGLEFIDHQAPDRLVQTGDWRSWVSRDKPSGDGRTPLRPPPVERRTSTRLQIPLDVLLSRLDAEGRVIEQERTFTENFGRGGARVMTCLQSTTTGEVVLFAEVGGDFRTRATVRHTYIGNDRVKRLNLEFLDRQAPDRLVPAAASMSMSRVAPGSRTGIAATRGANAPDSPR
jgi:hypothetical protein